MLLPDNGVWRVAGAAGIRPLEWRYVVEPDSWLVNTVVSGDRGATWVKIYEVNSGEWGIGGKPLTTQAVKELAAGRQAA